MTEETMVLEDTAPQMTEQEEASALEGWESGEITGDPGEEMDMTEDEDGPEHEEPDATVGEMLTESQWRELERQRDFMSFAKAHPELTAQDIPEEVWRAVAGGMTLCNAWRSHQTELMRVKLINRQRAEENRRRSTGSRKTGGSGGETDYFDKGWGEI